MNKREEVIAPSLYADRIIYEDLPVAGMVFPAGTPLIDIFPNGILITIEGDEITDIQENPSEQKL